MVNVAFLQGAGAKGYKVEILCHHGFFPIKQKMLYAKYP
jgi:hypothetical protein